MLSRVLYSPNEPWSFANVATLAGIHQGVPVPLNSSVTSPATPLYGFSVFQDLPVAFDVHSQWADAPTATAWGISNLHPLCNETASLVVLQVLFWNLQHGCDLVTMLTTFHSYLFDTALETHRGEPSLLQDYTMDSMGLTCYWWRKCQDKEDGKEILRSCCNAPDPLGLE